MHRHELVRYLLDPASIAVIGASDNPDRIGGRPLRILAERGYRGRVYPVNPKYATAQGLQCYPDIASLPDDVELFIFCLPAASAVEALELAAARGARAAVVFSGGFAEIGPEGRALQERVGRVAADHEIAIVGPNSLGVASFTNASFATFATTLATMPQIEAGGIALVSQSGGTAFNLFTEAYWNGARFSHVIATGNEAGMAFPDYLRYLAADDATTAVIGYLEGVTDGAELAGALGELREARKPVFLLKTGVSERGSRSVASHTAQLSGDDSAFDALFERYGVIRLSSMDEAVDVARALSLETTGDGVAIATNSGGAAAYLADASDRFGVSLAALSDSTLATLRSALPEFAGLTNPIDFTAQVINDRGLMAATLRALDQDPAVDSLIVFLGSMEYLADDLIASLVAVRSELQNPLVVSWLGVSEQVRLAGMRAGLVMAADPSRALRGIGLVRAGRAALGSSTGGAAATATPPADFAGLDLTPRLVEGGRKALDEWQVGEALERIGAPVLRRARISNAEEAVGAAEQLGYPVVVKLIEPFLAHRARVGAVRADVSSPEQLREFVAELIDRFGMTSALVVRQSAPGVELIAGVLADPVFGSRAVLGSGGIWANELNDVRTLVPPYTPDYIASELGRLKLRAQVNEVVGEDLGPTARELAELLQRLEAFVGVDGIVEIECNPVRITTGGLVVLDALAFFGEQGASSSDDPWREADKKAVSP